jgi:two-component SAPR family response regulator
VDLFLIDIVLKGDLNGIESAQKIKGLEHTIYLYYITL